MRPEETLREAMLYEPQSDKAVGCRLCPHQCRIEETEFGQCGMRQNLKGHLYTHAYGAVIAANADPIEKKPLYHFLPGTRSFSMATAGCNFRCAFCQNWQISQANKKRYQPAGNLEFSPQQIVEAARARRCRSISYTYTEPTVFFEYAYDTARLARKAGLANIFVTNGFITTRALETMEPYLDACNVDLKAFRNEFYKNVCGGRLQPVLDTIGTLRKMGIWVEITTLIVPGANDSEAELRDIAEFLADLDPAIPWHISRFHPDYRYTDTKPTPRAVMDKARELGKAAGLKHIYAGNMTGVPRDTRCPQCRSLLIQRDGATADVHLDEHGRCPHCSWQLAGIFEPFGAGDSATGSEAPSESRRFA